MQKIRIDFDNPGLPQHISAVENDSQSRFFQATLYENGKAYTAPEGAAYSIMYRGFGPQNQGWYDTINDGAGKRAACAVSGNVVTCEIARQALQVPGHVSIVLCVTTGKGYMLKSWPIECDCKNDRYDSTVEIQSFFYVTQISNESWTQAIQAVEELKNTIDPTLTLSGKAADAAKVGEAVNAEATRAKAAEEENAKGVSQLKEDLANIGKVITSESFSEQIASTFDFSARSTATLNINHYISTGMFGGIGGFKNGHHYKLVIITSETFYVTIKSLLYGSYEDVILDSTYMQSNTPYVIDVPTTIDFSNADKYVVFQQGDNYVANANIYIYDVGTISEEILNNVDFSTHKNPIEYQSVNIPKKTFHNGIIQENIIYKEDASFLGDSLTAVGSGSQYIDFVSDGLGLSNTHNCGNYGTRVSGGENSSDSFWTNKRVNELSLSSGVLFIMGGTNDAPYITVQDSDFTIENHDTNNFVGAYNVLISKVLYKYLKLSSGYYSDIDYSGITQVEKAKPFFRIILITPPKRFDSIENLKKVEETANYVIKIGQLWGLPVCDVNHQMNMNIINKDNYFTHQTEKDYLHFDVNGHRELANIVNGKVKSLN